MKKENKKVKRITRKKINKKKKNKK